MAILQQHAGPNNQLTDIQISLLRLFDRGISENETLEVRKMLMDYFDRELQEELTKVMKEKQYSENDFRQMLSDDHFVK